MKPDYKIGFQRECFSLITETVLSLALLLIFGRFVIRYAALHTRLV